MFFCFFYLNRSSLCVDYRVDQRENVFHFPVITFCAKVCDEFIKAESKEEMLK